jgi:coproporphyrinogen III oxidase
MCVSVESDGVARRALMTELPWVPVAPTTRIVLEAILEVSGRVGAVEVWWFGGGVGFVISVQMDG